MVSDIIETGMDQKLAVGLVIAFVAISAIVFVLYQQQEGGPKEIDYEPDFDELDLLQESDVPVGQDSILEECGSQETQYKRDLCWQFEAFNSQDAGKCINIEASVEEGNCIRAVAKNFLSEQNRLAIESCQASFPSEFEKFYECLDRIYPSVKQDKLGICNSRFSGQPIWLYRCHMDVASELLDQDICTAIPAQYQNYRQMCFNAVESEF